MAIAVMFAACNKKDDNKDTNPSVTTKTKTDYLTGGKWQQTAAVMSETVGGQTTDFDMYAQYGDCVKDDFTTFSKDGKMVFDEGATKCDPTDDQTTEGTWKFIDNETKLVTTEDGRSDTATIKELTESVVKISYTLEDDSAVMTTNITYKRIN